jgi:hypothetical protein
MRDATLLTALMPLGLCRIGCTVVRLTGLALCLASIAACTSNVHEEELRGITTTLKEQEPPSSQTLPANGSEVVLVFISNSVCTGNGTGRLDEAIRTSKTELRARVAEEGHTFYSIGAAVEWDIEGGIAYLVDGTAPGYTQKEFGSWDEIWVGRDWLNNAAIEHMWRADRVSVIPQLIVLQRSVVLQEDGPSVGTSHVLSRVRGSAEIVRWFDAGMPLDGLRAAGSQ